jgi:putative membrane-bound dehydrogenase-like protein
VKRSKKSKEIRWALLSWLLAVWLGPTPVNADPKNHAEADIPRAHDPRLQVDLFAVAPDIVHPIAIDFDRKGRLLVIESHTHFPPKDYKGPRHDRIRVLEDTRGQGKADRFTTFFEGTHATMGIAVHPDGSVYLATRNEILRLRDTRGTGKADDKKRIVFLDTKGAYPHNGLSGLSFDSKGDLYFGMGENLGADYKLIGSDGTILTGGGEGGNIYHCTAEGNKLRRVATGFWNPFGTCRDIFGRLIAVDNDPDAMPPCRMVHVVEGGDYGFQFRYGRAGRHIFQAWNGELPGTLPYITGTGEAPCGVLSYESDGLPREYLGSLLVASWADHRIERYVLKERGASFVSERLPFVEGGKDFRPVGIAVAPDGSLFISDWVLSSYTLHGRGAIWHIRTKKQEKRSRPTSSHPALLSLHRPLREAAARQLATEATGRDVLRAHLADADPRVRAACLSALIDCADPRIDLNALADKDPLVGIRAMAVRALVGRGGSVARFTEARNPPALRLEASAGLKDTTNIPRLLQLLADKDPFLQNAAAQQLARSPKLLMQIDSESLSNVRQRIGILLAHRASGRTEALKLIPAFLVDVDEDVRFLAAKWISDQKLEQFRPLIVRAMKDRTLNIRMFLAYSTALARIDNQEVNEARLANYFFDRLVDGTSAPALRVMALQLIPPTHPKLTLDLLGKLLHGADKALQVEAARALCEYPSAKKGPLLLDVACDARLDKAVRAQAIAGLAGQSQEQVEKLLRLALEESPALRDEALRTLIGTKLLPAQQVKLKRLAESRPEAAMLVARALGKPFFDRRPPADDVSGWLKRLEGRADVAAGRRVLFHPKLAGCYLCHRVEGRGRDIGPDLSTVGRAGRKHILESILQPSTLIAPHYQSWDIETKDGKKLTGMLVKTELDDYTYVDAKGKLFKLNTRNIAESQPSPVSIMPTGLPDLMTDQEMRDLLAYLCARR